MLRGLYDDNIIVVNAKFPDEFVVKEEYEFLGEELKERTNMSYQ